MTFWEPLGPLGGGPTPPPGGLPDGPWPLDSPESQNVSQPILATVRGIQHGVVIRNGVEIYTWGDPERVLDWASCNRTWQDKQWGKWVLQNGMFWLDRLVDGLPCDSARHLPNPDAYLKNVCSYTSLPPVGQVWNYSSGDWWPWQAQALAELNGCATVADAWALQIQPHLGGSTFRPGTADDGTLRVKASVRDNARLAMLVLNGGLGIHNTRLCDSAYINGGIAGGPNWDGYPFRNEGYQTHLVRDHRIWDDGSSNNPKYLNLPGVPDGGFMARDGSDDYDSGHGVICGIPSLNLIVCARGGSPDQYLGTICSACS